LFLPLFAPSSFGSAVSARCFCSTGYLFRNLPLSFYAKLALKAISFKALVLLSVGAGIAAAIAAGLAAGVAAGFTAGVAAEVAAESAGSHESAGVAGSAGAIAESAGAVEFRRAIAEAAPGFNQNGLLTFLFFGG